MSHTMDLERRVQEILHRHGTSRRTSSRAGTASTALVFLIGILVGVLVTSLCAPMNVTKTGTEHQPWKIRYTTSGEP